MYSISRRSEVKKNDDRIKKGAKPLFLLLNYVSFISKWPLSFTKKQAKKQKLIKALLQNLKRIKLKHFISFAI